VLLLVRVLALFLGDERGNQHVRQDATLSADHQSARRIRPWISKTGVRWLQLGVAEQLIAGAWNSRTAPECAQYLFSSRVGAAVADWPSTQQLAVQLIDAAVAAGAAVDDDGR